MSCDSTLKCHNLSFTCTSSRIEIAPWCKNTLWDTLTQVKIVFLRSMAHCLYTIPHCLSSVFDFKINNDQVKLEAKHIIF